MPVPLPSDRQQRRLEWISEWVKEKGAVGENRVLGEGERVIYGWRWKESMDVDV